MLEIAPNPGGGYVVSQSFPHPRVYLDHWAVRLFSDDGPLRERFVTALHKAGGTWLFSTANLYEFTAVTDLRQAEEAEALLERALPAVYVADTTLDPGFLFPEGAPAHAEAPDRHWILSDLSERALIQGGRLNMRRFVQDAVSHAHMLRPLFTDVKAAIAAAVMRESRDAAAITKARRYRPQPGMSLRDALMREVLREPLVNRGYTFDENDAMDFIHAVPAVAVCDFVLLDARWCHKMESASRRLKKAGVTGHIATCFPRAKVHEFLTEPEAFKGPGEPSPHNAPSQR